MDPGSRNAATVATDRHDSWPPGAADFGKQALPLLARAIHSTWNGIDVRLIFILAAVMAMTLGAACTGCLICCCRQKRTQKRRVERFIEHAKQGKETANTSANNVVEVTGCSEFDETTIRHMNTIMALHAFEGRELEVYKLERRRKRCGRLTLRSSQHCPLPALIQSLQGQVLPQVAKPEPAIVPDQLEAGIGLESGCVKGKKLLPPAGHDEPCDKLIEKNKPLEMVGFSNTPRKNDRPAQETLQYTCSVHPTDLDTRSNDTLTR